MDDQICGEALLLATIATDVYDAVGRDNPSEARSLLIRQRTMLGNLERLIAEEQQRRLDGEYE